MSSIDVDKVASPYDMSVRAGMDIGNGYVKGKVSFDGGAPRLIDMPSAVAWFCGNSFIPATADADYMAMLANELDADVVSPAVHATDAHRVVFGRRAVASGLTAIAFDIDDACPKCDNSLSGQLILGSLAAEAVRVFFERTGELPAETLHLDVVCACALPISDYMSYKERYRAVLMGARHTVHIHNFEREVTCDIVFTGVEVLPEGAAAQFAINDLGAAFLDMALDDCRAHGCPVDAAETGESLLSYDNTVGIDIGEGTVNFPVFRDGRVSVEASSSINRGYGTVLDAVVAECRNLAYAPHSRKDLAEFMLKENPNGRDRRVMAKLQRMLDEQIEVFCRDVMMEYSRVMGKVKLGVDVIYVYGGGANAVRRCLWPQLVEASKLDDDIYTPVVYLDSAYSRDLNRNGLYIVAAID